MKCLHCDSVMLPARFARAEVDRCSTCGGIWFDRGELAKARKTKSVTRNVTPTVKIPLEALPELGCPRCEARGMNLVRVHSFAVQACASCQGLFLRGTEIESLTKAWRAQGRINRKRIREKIEKQRRDISLAILAGVVFSG